MLSGKEANNGAEQPKAKRGFAAMSAEQRKLIASKGGQAAHKKGSAHRFSSQEAKTAGSKGGTSVSKDRRYMAEIGRKGGHATARKTNSSNRNSTDVNTSTGQQ